jgi:uroporphyrinogen-III decarboxylase
LPGEHEPHTALPRGRAAPAGRSHPHALPRVQSFDAPTDDALRDRSGRRLASAEALLARLGADFWASGSRADAWATFLPAYRGPQPQPPHITDASYFYTLGIPGISSGADALGFEYPAYVDPPLAWAERASDIPAGYLTQQLAYFDFDSMINRQTGTLQAVGDPLSYETLAARDDHIICIGILNNLFMICSYLRGMEQFLMDLALDRALAERLIGEVGEFCLEFNRRYLAAFGVRAELYAAWDDVSGQDGMMFSPALFRRYFQPLYRELIAEVKRYGLIFSWHCCGSVHQVLPSMIEAGIDVLDVVQTSARDMDLLDVVQTSARDMDLGIMYRRYGQDVCLSGGIDVQKLLVSGTPAQVRAEVRRAHDLWGARGGLVLGPSHEAAPETPLENVLAIYSA